MALKKEASELSRLNRELDDVLKAHEDLERKNRELEKDKIEMEARIDELRRMMAGGAKTTWALDVGATGVASAVHTKIFKAMTVKQHVVMQSVLLGLSNKEIETRMGVSENTVKTYVRGMLGKFGLSSRHQLEGEVGDALKNMPDADYEAAAGGLPKDWARDWVKKDPHKKLYFGKTK